MFMQEKYILGILFRSLLWPYLIIGMAIYHHRLNNFDEEDINTEQLKLQSKNEIKYLIVFWPLVGIINIIKQEE